MKKQILVLVTSVFLVGTSFSYADKKSSKSNNDNTEMMTIIDKGVKRTVPVNRLEKNDSLQGKSASTSNVEQKKGLLIRFTKSENLDIKDFEEKYALKLKEKMKIGYYIFQNKSKESDLVLMQRILKNETNIDSMKPNWKMKNSPR